MVANRYSIEDFSRNGVIIYSPIKANSGLLGFTFDLARGTTFMGGLRGLPQLCHNRLNIP